MMTTITQPATQLPGEETSTQAMQESIAGGTAGPVTPPAG